MHRNTLNKHPGFLGFIREELKHMFLEDGQSKTAFERRRTYVIFLNGADFPVFEENAYAVHINLSTNGVLIFTHSYDKEMGVVVKFVRHTYYREQLMI